MEVSGSQLAAQLGVSRARVSQLVSEGKLDGCFTGEGRERRFDLSKSKAALLTRLDKGQMLGNGADTKRALREIEAPQLVQPDQTPRKQVRDGALLPTDPDRYELARAESAEQDARRKRRDNERDEGKWVLAEAAERETARLVAREVGQFETVLRDGARAVADKLGVDYREVRAILLAEWREHREKRSRALTGEAAVAPMADDETEANV